VRNAAARKVKASRKSEGRTMIQATQDLFDAASSHWQRQAALCRTGLPRACDLKPEEMAAWMPDTLLVELDRLLFDFRFALVGTRVVAFYGIEFTGQTLTQLPFPLDWNNETTFWAWWNLVENPRPVRTTAQHLLAPGCPIVLDRLVLPYQGRNADRPRLMVLQAARLENFAGCAAAARPASQRKIDRRTRPRPAFRNPWAA
jgi:hypothetical protein